MDDATRLELSQIALKLLATDPAAASVLSVLAQHNSEQSTPEIVRAFLRADRKLSLEQAAILADMFELMYNGFVGAIWGASKGIR